VAQIVQMNPGSGADGADGRLPVATVRHAEVHAAAHRLRGCQEHLRPDNVSNSDVRPRPAETERRHFILLGNIDYKSH